jgi:hypothetical protein
MKGNHLPLYDSRLQIMVEQSDVAAVALAAREDDAASTVGFD